MESGCSSRAEIVGLTIMYLNEVRSISHPTMRQVGEYIEDNFNMDVISPDTPDGYQFVRLVVLTRHMKDSGINMVDAGGGSSIAVELELTSEGESRYEEIKSGTGGKQYINRLASERQQEVKKKRERQRELDNSVENNLEAISERYEFDTLKEFPLSRLREEKETVEKEFADAVDNGASSAVKRKRGQYQKEAMRNLERAIRLKEATRNTFLIGSILAVLVIAGLVVFLRNSLVEGIITTVIGSLVTFLFQEVFLKNV